MDFVPMLALLATAKKVVDLSKYVTNRDINGAITQLYVWLAGIAVVWIFAQSDFAETLVFGGVSLGDANLGSLIAIGITVASAGSVVTDVIKSIDRTDSAAMPKLLPGAADGPVDGSHTHPGNH